MEQNERIEQQRVVLNNPGERREVYTETNTSSPGEFSLSPGTMALIAFLAIVAIGIAVFVVYNKNQNEAANRELANQQMSREQQAQQPVTQPPAAAPPVIIQQPAPIQPTPIVIEKPIQPSGAIMDDATIEELAEKRLSEETDLAGVSVTIIEGRAVLTGTAKSAALKTKAGQVVRAVRGVKTVDNQIVSSDQ